LLQDDLGHPSGGLPDHLGAMDIIGPGMMEFLELLGVGKRIMAAQSSVLDIPASAALCCNSQLLAPCVAEVSRRKPWRINLVPKDAYFSDGPRAPQGNLLYGGIGTCYPFRTRQGRLLMFGVPNSFPNFPIEVSMLKLDFRHSY
jgi:hypothetical protein